MRVSELLQNVYNGTIVLPDFQRSFIWEPEDIRLLLMSVLEGIFIGSFLVLEDTKDSRFALRLIEGVKEVKTDADIKPQVKILLDGQQRTTALFYALYEPNIPLKNRKSPYRFYLDIDKALDKDWENSVGAVSVNDKRKLSEIKNRKNIIFFSELRDLGKLAERLHGHVRFPEIFNLLNGFLNQEINVVSLPTDIEDNKIVETFERINRTGEPLSIFELLTARLYKSGVKLRDLLEISAQQYPFLGEVVPPEFVLRVIALIRNKEPKRKYLLELEGSEFKEDWENACIALKKAYSRVTDVKNGYGVLDLRKWIPYSTLLVPLAALIHYLRSEDMESPTNYAKIDRWYWVTVFSNRYDQGVDSSSYSDYIALRDWFNNDSSVPDFIQKFEPNTVDLEINKQGSATYRGVICLIVLKGARDFKTGQPPQFEREKVQDDHIFPKSIYNEDCVLNRTLISTNLKKSDMKPSEYFGERLKQHGRSKLIEVLESHIIPEDALNDLLSDNLLGFMEKRKVAIIREIQRITCN